MALYGKCPQPDVANVTKNSAAGSVRRRALLAIVQGPVDWPVVSAMMALTELAKTSESIEQEVSALFTQLLARRLNNSPCDYLYPLVVHWLTHNKRRHA